VPLTNPIVYNGNLRLIFTESLIVDSNQPVTLKIPVNIQDSSRTEFLGFTFEFVADSGTPRFQLTGSELAAHLTLYNFTRGQGSITNPPITFHLGGRDFVLRLSRQSTGATFVFPFTISLFEIEK